MTKPGAIAIYHRMYEREGFLETAGMLWAMVRDAAARYPGSPRMLYLDIDGHGHFEPDDEAAEVISFTRAALGPFLTEAPWGRTAPDAPQSEQLPGVIITFGEDRRPVVLTGERDQPVGGTRAGTGTVAAVYARTHGAFAREEETGS